jgi:outer membrane protein
VLDAQNNVDAATAQLNEILGFQTSKEYQLVDDTTPSTALPLDAEELIRTALQQRPDLQSLDLEHQAAQKFSRAQHEQLLPTVSAFGVVGTTPVGSSTYYAQDWYGAAAVNISVPIFNGFRFTAQASEADFRAKAVAERTRDLQNLIVRDVRTAWLAANTDQQRMVVTRQLVQEANSSLDLAKTRYQLGLGSIVELSQAQLQQTQAAIADANAKFQYEADLAAIRFQTGTQP